MQVQGALKILILYILKVILKKVFGPRPGSLLMIVVFNCNSRHDKFLRTPVVVSYPSRLDIDQVVFLIALIIIVIKSKYMNEKIKNFLN